MSKKENYNPNSANHNDDYYNDGWDEDSFEERHRDKEIPRHRDVYEYMTYDYSTGKRKEQEFNNSPDFIHKLDEIPKEANVPPELLRDMFNGLVVKVNKLIDWHNSLEEFEYNKIKNENKS